jgi:hypothetical protein
MGGNQHLGVQMNQPAAQQSHRRNQSALPNVGNMGPPPAPSSQGEFSSLSSPPLCLHAHAYTTTSS